MVKSMKITANIATYNNRNINPTLNSLKNQVDEIRVYDNEKEPNDLTDNGKFFGLDDLKEPEYFFTADDDIIFPPDYVEKTIEAIEMYGTIITYHGRKLIAENVSYYKGHTAYRCLDEVKENLIIDVCGTGVTAFRTDYFHPKGLASCPLKKMSDLIFSLEASRQGKTIGLIEHKAGWIKHVDNAETIYKTEASKPTPIQNHLADEILRLNNQ
jgi:hypothetical protein